MSVPSGACAGRTPRACTVSDEEHHYLNSPPRLECNLCNQRVHRSRGTGKHLLYASRGTVNRCLKLHQCDMVIQQECVSS